MDAIQLFCALYLIQYVGGYYLHPPMVGVTGGHKIHISNAPFIASLVRYIKKLPNGSAKRQICGASVIHEKFILTAAHCVLGESFRDVIRVGSSQLYDGGDTYEVEKFIAHENFSSDSFKNVGFSYDVALVKLKKNINFSETISKIVLADENVKIEPFMSVNITGWGVTEPFGRISEELRQVSVEVRDIDDCKIYPWVTDNEICVWSMNKGSCKGDSGGPMTLSGVQIGVVSSGMGCGYRPSFYAKVSFVLPWINDNINKNL